MGMKMRTIKTQMTHYQHQYSEAINLKTLSYKKMHLIKQIPS